MRPHQESPVKVTAWVDEGVAPLVIALNEFDDVMTLDSCQGNGCAPAYVMFCYRQDASAAAASVAALAALLSGGTPDLEYALSAEWRPGAEEPLLRLSCPPSAVDRVAELLSVSRTTVFAGGRPHTGLRS